MPAVTPAKGIPYALGTDFSDPRVLRDLALTEDALFAGYDAAFTAGPRPAAFMCRSGADTGGFSNGSIGAIVSSVTEWNTSNGAIASSGTWTQDLNEVPSWWMFGMNLFEAVASGAPTVGSLMQAIFLVTSLDPVTLLSATTALGDGNPFLQEVNRYSTETPDTGTTNEFFTGFCIVPMYKGSVVPVFGNRDTSGGQTKKASAGTVFWGVRLGAI
jgi:hypothetical protein